jgi:hypothetical protein
MTSQSLMPVATPYLHALLWSEGRPWTSGWRAHVPTAHKHSLCAFLHIFLFVSLLQLTAFDGYLNAVLKDAL